VNHEEEFDVFLEPEAILAGTVLDESGKPVAGARIVISWGQGETMNVLIDERDGAYKADALGPGKYTLSVIPSVGPARISRSVELEAGKTTTEVIRVERPTPGEAAGKK
jgi:hypothetical protein